MSDRASPMFQRKLNNSTLQESSSTESNVAKESGISANTLWPVSVELLYEGMFVQDDIYDSGKDRLLIHSGNVLDEIHIERIKRLNSGSDTIYVTGRTHKALVTKRPDIDIDSRNEVEESTGYAKTKDDTFLLLEEIASKKTVDMDSLVVVSDDLTSRLESMPQNVIISLINAMAPVDEYLQRHCVNVGLLNGLIGRWMGLSDADIDRLVLIGFLHDCGKTLIPPKILNKPSKLTVAEYEVIKNHAVYTYDLMKELPEQVRIASSSHHERLDGSGYSKKLMNDGIMLEARITAISDTYDAIISQRKYQKPQSPFKILSIFGELGIDKLDKEIIRIFTENMPKELIGKPIMMSDGTIGIVRDFDPDDIEYPMIELGGRIFKSYKDLYPMHMFNDD